MICNSILWEIKWNIPYISILFTSDKLGFWLCAWPWWNFGLEHSSQLIIRCIKYGRLGKKHFKFRTSVNNQYYLLHHFPFPFLLFPSVFLHCWLKMVFLFLLAILWKSAFSWVYISLSPLSFTFLLFSTVCNASSNNRFAFLHFFFSWGWFCSLPPVQCYEPLSIVLAFYQI